MTPVDTSDSPRVPLGIAQSIRDHWGWFLGEGIALVVLGLVAIVLPAIAGLVATVFLGWLLLAAGIIGLVATVRARRAPGFGWSLLSAIVALIAGGVLLWNPLQGLVTLTLVLTAFFVADGILMIVLAFVYRRQLSGRWPWLLVNGVIDLILAAIVISGLPQTLVWALGLIVGVDMLFGGVSLIALALEAHQPDRGRTGTPQPAH